MQTTVNSTEVLLIAEGATETAQSNARGHLFEEFVAQLMALFGYERPTRSSLNISSNGIELDVSSTHRLTKQRMVAECKAYTSAISAREVATFYGKLNAERFTNSDCFGYFVALPRLTKDGRELAAKCENNDKRFRVYTSDMLVELLLERGEISPFAEVLAAHQKPGGPLSDHALLVTSDGLFYAAHELEFNTRLPVRVLVFPAKPTARVPSKVIEMLGAAASYSRGIPCVATAAANSARVEKTTVVEDTVIEVTGSSGDFEYQFPAAPRFFVGRQAYVADGQNLFRSLADSGAHAQVLVLNAQSGWGKSSLALRLLETSRSLGGDGVCIDCRTATHATFVSAALRFAFLRAQASQVLELPSASSFATVSSSLQTLKDSTFAAGKPVCVFFDQFENVFQNSALTREFRDLALGVLDVRAPLLIGFSWKTDFVAFTESYPYQLRDDIRSCATIFSLPPFGPSEIGELISRLQKSSGQKIHQYLRERMREYSQGLPWLFKKLGSHIIREIKNGTTQDRLLSEVLNIQSLFDSDISGLGVSERQALNAIARRAPLPVSEAVELTGGNKDVLQSLFNQRLLVSIGEKLDIYWDVFRDYLNQGSVPLQESYVLRMTPNGVSKLLIAIKDSGGTTTPDDAAKHLGTSVISVLNMARDLRQLGVLAAQEGVLRFSEEIASAPNINQAIMARAAIALKRHRVYSLLTSLAPPGGRLRMNGFAEALPKAYPAVEAQQHSWANYGRAFAYWFQFAGLVTIERDEMVIGQPSPILYNLMRPGKKRALKGVQVFPRCQFEPVFRLLRDVLDKKAIADGSSVRKALVDAKFLEWVEETTEGSLTLTAAGQALLAASDSAKTALVRKAFEPQLAYRIALPLLSANSSCAPKVIGRALARELKVDWTDGTAQIAGKCIRNWMRAAGITTTQRKPRIPAPSAP